MNNEIKEILEFKENADYKKLSCDEIAILRDYITNLQQENERLKREKIEKELCESLLEECDEHNKHLQQRIDKAIELLQDFDYLDKIDCFCEPTKVLNILEGKDTDDI